MPVKQTAYRDGIRITVPPRLFIFERTGGHPRPLPIRCRMWGPVAHVVNTGPPDRVETMTTTATAEQTTDHRDDNGPRKFHGGWDKRAQWIGRAKCRGMDPEMFDLSGPFYARTNKDDRAAALCEGCPVIRQCALDALDPLAIGTVRAGVWIAGPGGAGTAKRNRTATARLRRIVMRGAGA